MAEQQHRGGREREPGQRHAGPPFGAKVAAMPIAASSQVKGFNRKNMTGWLNSYGKLFLNQTYAIFGVSAHPHPLDEASDLR